MVSPRIFHRNSWVFIGFPAILHDFPAEAGAFEAHEGFFEAVRAVESQGASKVSRPRQRRKPQELKAFSVNSHVKNHEVLAAEAEYGQIPFRMSCFTYVFGQFPMAFTGLNGSKMAFDTSFKPDVTPSRPSPRALGSRPTVEVLGTSQGPR